MAAEPVVARVQGLAELKEALRALPAQLRRRALRNALAAGGRVFRDEARRLAPVLQAPIVRKGQLIRKPGTVRDAIRVRTSKLARRAGDVGVFVNVLPAKGAKYKALGVRVGRVKVRGRVQTAASQRGARSPNDPFYWRFLEFGTSKMQASPFLKPASAKQPDALRAFERTLGPAVLRLNVKRAAA